MAASPRNYSMRKMLKDIFSPAEASQLASALGRVPFDAGSIPKIVVEMLALGAAITPKSYAVIERNHAGHPWHVDTGDRNQMPWCRWVASTGLTPPSEFSGGEFEYDEPFEHYDSHYLTTLIHSADQLHRVMPHEGNRTVLLMFLGEPHAE